MHKVQGVVKTYAHSEEVNQVKVIEGLYYTKDHEWLKVEGAVALVGITEFAQDKLGDIAYVELPDVGKTFSAGDIFGVIESVKTAADLFMPVAGTITEKNVAAEDAPESIADDAFDSWLIKFEMNDPSELESLLDATAYTELIKE
jgi:glycine cleavage system H protein